jgi:hypothetical protein
VGAGRRERVEQPLVDRVLHGLESLGLAPGHPIPGQIDIPRERRRKAESPRDVQRGRPCRDHGRRWSVRARRSPFGDRER